MRRGSRAQRAAKSDTAGALPCGGAASARGRVGVGEATAIEGWKPARRGVGCRERLAKMAFGAGVDRASRDWFL